MRTCLSLRCMMLTAHWLCSHHTVPHSIRLTQSPLESSPSLQFENDGALQKSREITRLRDHEMPGQATARQLRAAALSVRVIYLSVSTVPCCVHLVFPLTRSTNQCYDTALKVNSSATEYEQTPNSLYNKHQIVIKRFPLSNKCMYRYVGHVVSAI